MRVGADKGSLVTIGGRDPRVTRSGYYIRKYKFDELPQLINVFIGDMSLVGPRPEVRHYVNYWTPEQMHVLDVRPGITDPASIKFSNENELMEKTADPEDYYIHVIMQEKIKLYLEYVKNASFWYDIKLIFKTFEVIVKELFHLSSIVFTSLSVLLVGDRTPSGRGLNPPQALTLSKRARDVTAPSRCSELLHSKDGGPKRSSPCYAGWDRLTIACCSGGQLAD